jgi:hypothetical protein
MTPPPKPASRLVSLYQKIEEIIVHDAPFVFLGHHNFFSLTQPRLKGPLIDTSWPFRLDRVWLDR